MTPTRPAVVLFVGLILLAGCGRPRPAKPTDPGNDPKAGPVTPAVTPGTAPQGVASPQAPAGGPGPVGRDDPAHQAAEQFMVDLRGAAGTGTAPLLARLTPDFLKAIGRPVAFAAEKEQGYSPSAAGGWLVRASGPLATVGAFNNGAGRLLLRVVPADGGGKVDWFGLGTAKTADFKPANPEEAAKEFAALALLDAVTADGQVLSRDDRLPLVAAAITPRLKVARAEPFSQDKDRGYDYSPGALGRYVDGLGVAGAEAYTRTPTADGFAVTVTKGGAAKSFTLKLAKDPARGWLVDDFAPQ